MRRRRKAMAERNRGGGAAAREIDIPLPTSGLFVDAKTAGISGLYAATLNNFRTDGLSLELRKSVRMAPADEIVLQRVPFAFGVDPRYINLRSFQAECQGQVFLRAFDGNAMTAYISSQAVMADGLDLPVIYNGTGFQNGLFTTTTGVPPSTFDGIIAHHDRLYFWKTSGKLEFYYADIGAVMGPLVRFPLDRLGNITGGIQAMFSVTLDAGENANDALAIFTTTGEIVVYEGLNPGDANDWSLMTRIKIAPALSRFGFVRVGGDVWMMTTLGVVSISDTVQRGVLALVSEFTRPIADDILALVRAGGGAEWQLHITADGSQIIINYFTPALQKQYIWQTDSKAWSTSDYPARIWHNLVLATEFTTGPGRRGTVIEDADSAEVITAVWHTGWFRMGGMGQVAYIRPTIIAKGALSVKVSVLTDYDETPNDILEAEQTVTIEPDNPPSPGGRVALNDIIAIGAQGSTFQLRVEIRATWSQIVQIQAGII